MRSVFFLFFSLFFYNVHAQSKSASQSYPKAYYTKIERMIPMRDGTRLFTAIYIPKDTKGTFPFLMTRTPYSCAPYGENNFPNKLGPNALFQNEKYIYVYQDVRGRHMSEGQFQEMTPAIEHKRNIKEVDESSDANDTIDWLLKNIQHNNGKVGIYGISYPGFYASASLPNAHPAIKAVSPQAPVTDEFEGDDANHRGAFFLMDNFSFMNFFDHPRPGPWKTYPQISDQVNIKDVYSFYLNEEPLKNFNQKYFHDSSKIWNEYLQHPTKDAYWQARDIRPHLKNIKPAVLVTGGWFDAEDMFGALKTYEAIEKQSPGNDCHLFMGPWTHGAWENKNWSRFATYNFEGNTSSFFQQTELDFFNFYLKGKGKLKLPEATVFVTGSNQWKSFDRWPPLKSHQEKWYLGDWNTLVPNVAKGQGHDTYISNPFLPVPYINQRSADRINEYMGADQSFVTKRNDVLVFTSDLLQKDMTLTGEIIANLFVSITSTDADFVVKVIDVLPDNNQTQQLVRAEVLRGKFRNSFSKPEHFVPDQVTPVRLTLNDVAHTFKKGHRLMIQIQSSWFPLVDLNPQKFMNIPDAERSDFHKASITIYHDKEYPSNIEVRVLN